MREVEIRIELTMKGSNQPGGAGECVIGHHKGTPINLGRNANAREAIKLIETLQVIGVELARHVHDDHERRKDLPNYGDNIRP